MTYREICLSFIHSFDSNFFLNIKSENDKSLYRISTRNEVCVKLILIFCYKTTHYYNSCDKIL